MILIRIPILISFSIYCRLRRRYAMMAIRIGWCLLVCCMIWVKCCVYLVSHNGPLLVIHSPLAVPILTKWFIPNFLQTMPIIAIAGTIQKAEYIPKAVAFEMCI